jgi:hypothetical protein
LEEKKQEAVFIGVVELVDLDDCDVLDRKLQCDNTDLDDDKGPNAGGIGVLDGPGSCSQAMETNDESASMLVLPEVGVHLSLILWPQLPSRTSFLMQLVRPLILML